MIQSVHAQETQEQSVIYRRSFLFTVMVDAPNLPYADSKKKKSSLGVLCHKK
jgi:hypothetical protein